LIIIDEIHLLGTERGPVLEVIVSRMRYISEFLRFQRLQKLNQEEGENSTRAIWASKGNEKGPAAELHHVRFVGLSTALANAVDLADWLGIPDTQSKIDFPGLFNFKQDLRPVPCKMHITGFPGKHYCPRMNSMNKPAYAAIREYSPSEPSLVFVSSRRQTRITALALANLAAQVRRGERERKRKREGGSTLAIIENYSSSL